MFNVRLAEIGLNLIQAGLLLHVDAYGPLSQRELAELLDITRVATGTCIDDLEARGLVRRTADSNDRRVWLIVATPAAKALLERFNEIDAEVRAALRAGFDRRERHQLVDLLERLHTNASAIIDPSARAYQTRGARGRKMPSRLEDPE
jgi:DNA-binding MarR family transcriptional regulator